MKFSKLTGIFIALAATFSAASCSCVKIDDASEDETTSQLPSTSSTPETTSTDSGGSGRLLSLTAPDSFEDNDLYDPLTDHYTMTWSSVAGASSYEVAIGSSAGLTDILDWQDVGNTTSVSTSTLTIPHVGIFYASIRAVGSNGEKGEPAQGDGWHHLICPTNWIRVTGDATPGVGGTIYTQGTRTRHDGSLRDLSDFCIMKYEARIELNGVLQPKGDADDDEVDLTNAADVSAAMPVSRPDGRPMVRVERSADDDLIGAVGLCNKINGSGLVPGAVDANFHLMNNAQWQAVARDIEDQPQNSNAGVYNKGHSDVGPNQSIAASSDDNLGCIGMNSNGLLDPATGDDDCAGTFHINKRTHDLSNGEVVWDISGNVREWMIDNVYTGAGSLEPNPDLEPEGQIEYTALVCGAGNNEECFTSANRLTFGPRNILLTSTQGVGNFTGGYGVADGALVRGGHWVDSTWGGMYFANINFQPTSANAQAGVRCAWSP